MRPFTGFIRSYRSLNLQVYNTRCITRRLHVVRRRRCGALSNTLKETRGTVVDMRTREDNAMERPCVRVPRRHGQGRLHVPHVRVLLRHRSAELARGGALSVSAPYSLHRRAHRPRAAATTPPHFNTSIFIFLSPPVFLRTRVDFYLELYAYLWARASTTWSVHVSTCRARIGDR